MTERARVEMPADTALVALAAHLGTLYAAAKREGYPDTYTVLCFNCNMAKGIFGVCPHKVNAGG